MTEELPKAGDSIPPWFEMECECGSDFYVTRVDYGVMPEDPKCENCTAYYEGIAQATKDFEEEREELDHYRSCARQLADLLCIAPDYGLDAVVSDVEDLVDNGDFQAGLRAGKRTAQTAFCRITDELTRAGLADMASWVERNFIEKSESAEEDTAHLGPFTTVRACLECGVLISGGPTRCLYCANRSAEAEQLG